MILSFFTCYASIVFVILSYFKYDKLKGKKNWDFQLPIVELSYTTHAIHFRSNYLRRGFHLLCSFQLATVASKILVFRVCMYARKRKSPNDYGYC